MPINTLGPPNNSKQKSMKKKDNFSGESIIVQKVKTILHDAGKMFFLCFNREVFSLKKLFSLDKKLCQRDTKDFMASTVFIHLDHTLPSLEKAHLLPHCITFGSSQGFFCLKEARQPAQRCRLDHCSQRLFSSWARGSSLKHPGSTAKRRAQLHLRNLEEMKSCILQVWGSLPQIPTFRS